MFGGEFSQTETLKNHGYQSINSRRLPDSSPGATPSSLLGWNAAHLGPQTPAGRPGGRRGAAPPALPGSVEGHHGAGRPGRWSPVGMAGFGGGRLQAAGLHDTRCVIHTHHIMCACTAHDMMCDTIHTSLNLPYSSPGRPAHNKFVATGIGPGSNLRTCIRRILRHRGLRVHRHRPW